MNNLVIITSVICVPNTILSYSKIRSVYTSEERYEQTLKTIESIKKYISDSIIFFIECSDFDNNEYMVENIKNQVDYFLNINNPDKIKQIYSSSKSMGEGTMTIIALEDIIARNLKYKNLFKISGRYYLNNTFDYKKFIDNDIVILPIQNDTQNIFTCFYKINYQSTELLLKFLSNSIENFKNCEGYEKIFSKYIEHMKLKFTIKYINHVGINGNVTVCGTYIDM